MLNRSFSYTTLLRLLGILFIVLGIYEAYLFLSVFRHSQILSVALDVILSNPFGMSSPFYLGAPSFIGIGVFFLGLSSARVSLAYWCLQVAVWFVGINVWYQFNGNFSNTSVISPFVTPNNPWPQFILTLAISLILFIFYAPLTRVTRKFYQRGGASVAFHSSGQQ